MKFLAAPQSAASYSRGSVMSVRTALVAGVLAWFAAWVAAAHGQQSIHPKDPPKGLPVPAIESMEMDIKRAAVEALRQAAQLPPRNPWAPRPIPTEPIRIAPEKAVYQPHKTIVRNDGGGVLKEYMIRWQARDSCTAASGITQSPHQRAAE
jgi:hypothetical protein